MWIVLETDVLSCWNFDNIRFIINGIEKISSLVNILFIWYDKVLHERYENVV